MRMMTTGSRAGKRAKSFEYIEIREKEKIVIISAQSQAVDMIQIKL